MNGKNILVSRLYSLHDNAEIKGMTYLIFLYITYSIEFYIDKQYSQMANIYKP